MARQSIMQHLARWHIWLGWAVAIPLLLWTASGLLMVARPIEEVRGDHLRIKAQDQALPAGSEIAIVIPADKARPIRSVATAMADGQAITRIEYLDDTVARFDESGALLPALDAAAAQAIVARQIAGGDKVVSATLYPKGKASSDFRKPMPVWQVALEDGTHVYVGVESGKIEAVRTRWWRAFDFMWGLHIMDPVEREDTSHPLLIVSAALALIAAMLGTALLFRRRKALQAK